MIQGLANHTIVIARDGRECVIADSCAPIRNRDGQVVGAVLVFRDVTEEYAVQQALHDKNVELEGARDVADKANLAKSEFLSSMSHELRTPLNAILGFAQIMESAAPPPTPPQKHNFDQILKAGWYLLELINEILDLALTESGTATLSREPVSLVEVMLECRAMIEPQAQKRGISLTFPQFEGPCFVSADRTRVKQVLINLLFNAIKYNRPDGSVDVEYSLSSPTSVRIIVRDTGHGLDATLMGQLFQPFNRLGREASAEEGTGIGLMVTKRLVELMGGTIGAASTVGVGSVFWFELNLASPPLQMPGHAEPVTPPRLQVPETTPLRTVLYVEDNPANLELVEQLITRRPELRLLSAADGALGVEFARVYQPDVILMDINLPGMNGLEAMRILRADPATAQIPVIAISANAVPRDITRAVEAGFLGYLTKPIKVNQFMEALDAALIASQTGPDRAAAEETA
jgi:signal transduction histidine kinase/CheY-like chemotaxis protein